VRSPAPSGQPYLLELRPLTKLQLEHREQPLFALLIEVPLLHTQANLQVAERADDDADRIADAAMATWCRCLPAPAAEMSVRRPGPDPSAFGLGILGSDVYYRVRQARARSPGGAAIVPLCQLKCSSGVASMASRSVAGETSWTS
jgi:hypothetical protein